MSRFCKPSKAAGAPLSRHVYIAGLGDQMGTEKVFVKKLFEQFGELDFETSPNNDPIEFVEGKRYCYVSYVAESSAKAAVEAFSNSKEKISIEGESENLPKLLVKYAAIAEAKGPILEPQCTSSTQDVVVPGLTVIEDFITPEMEQELLQSDVCRADSSRWEELLSRRIQHYGLIFNYRTLMLDYSTSIPQIPTLVSKEILPRIMEKVADHYDDGIVPYELQQMTVNEYEGGQGIAGHIDTDACLGPDLAILCLGSGTVMTFQERRPKDASLAALTDYYPTPPVVARTVVPIKSSSGETGNETTASATQDDESDDDDDVVEGVLDNAPTELPALPVLAVTGAGSQGCRKYIRRKFVWLPPRSLLLMQGEARYNWSHGITPRTYDKVNGVLIPRQRRVSLTFRQVMLPGEVPSSRLKSSALELDHVFKVYDSIAVHWNHTRGRRKVHWHRVKQFLEELPHGALVADIGSGDGKYFNVNPGAIVIGCDRSLKLLQVSHESAHETFCCDAVKLPMRSNSFDASICIAVFHHLASLDRRIALLRELLRITRVGGEIMIQAWALEQDASSRWDFAGTGTGKPTQSANIASASNDAKEEGKCQTCSTAQQDVLVPWKLQQRFFVAKNDTSNPASNSNESVKEEEIDCDHVVKQEDGSLLFQRYCHVFKEGELEDLCSSCPGNRLLESGWDRGNWFIRLVKTADVSSIGITSISSSTEEMNEVDASHSDILSKAGVSSTGIMPRFSTRL